MNQDSQDKKTRNEKFQKQQKPEHRSGFFSVERQNPVDFQQFLDETFSAFKKNVVHVPIRGK